MEDVRVRSVKKLEFQCPPRFTGLTMMDQLVFNEPCTQLRGILNWLMPEESLLVAHSGCIDL